jgi:simple sugar transport system permease protein
MDRLKTFIQDFGWPRIIIFLFLVSLFIMAPFVQVRIDASISDVLNRFGQNAIMVLAMVPMIQSGGGLNFGLALGLVSGLLGATLSLEFELIGIAGFLGQLP